MGVGPSSSPDELTQGDRIAQPGDDKSSWGRSTRRGIAWSALAFLGSRGVNFISLLVIARLVTPSEFGVMAAILTFLSILELLSDLGMKSTVIYEQEQGASARVEVAFTINLAVVVALTVLGIAVSPLIAAFFGLREETWLFQLGAFCLLIIGLGNIQDALLVRDMRFRRRTTPQLVRSFVRAGTTIPLTALGLGAEGLVFGFLAGSIAWTAMLWSLRPLRLKLAFDPVIARSMLSYGMGASLIAVIGTFASRVDSLVIGNQLGNQALGLYTMAVRLPELLIESIAWNVSLVAFPALARRRLEDREAINHASLELLRWTALVAFPMAAGIAVLASPLIIVLFGARWSDAAGVLVAISVAQVFSITTFPLGDAFRAAGRQRAYIHLQLAATLVLIPLLIVASSGGIVMVAWAQTLVTAVFSALTLLNARRVLGVGVVAAIHAAVPGTVAALGVIAGAGAVRLAWPDASVAALVLGTLAGTAGAAVALRLILPGRWRELTTLVMTLAHRRRLGSAGGST